MQIHVKLDAFEGPLDLLLYLIKKAEVDIYEVSLVEITRQYMDVLREMREWQIEMASDFMVMAAHLMAIKSKKLLPASQIEEETESPVIEDMDSEEVIRQRLLKYKMYKEAAEKLKERQIAKSPVYSRPPEENLPWKAHKGVCHQPLQLKLHLNRSIYELATIYQELKERHLKTNLPRTVRRDAFSLQDKIKQLDKLLMKNQSVWFHQLLTFRTEKDEIVISFLAVLEISKVKNIVLEQDTLFGPIKITKLA